jgi:hypothetical protein
VDPHQGRFQIRKVSFCDYRGDPTILEPSGGTATAIYGRSLRHKPDRSSGVWIRLSVVSKIAGIVDKVIGPTCRSTRLLAGRVHLTGTSGTLVSGDPWVPMYLNIGEAFPNKCI